MHLAPALAQLPLLWRQGFRLRPTLAGHPALRRLWAFVLPAVIAVALTVAGGGWGLMGRLLRAPGVVIGPGAATPAAALPPGAQSPASESSRAAEREAGRVSP